MSVEFEDYSVKCKEAINSVTLAWLYEAAGELTSQTQRNTRVDTSQTKDSFTYRVDESKGEATIGSPLENAIWEEFGTGQYALHGDGRKTPWFYADRHGWYQWTKGKKPNRAMFRAFTENKEKLKRLLENKLKGI